MAIFNTSGKIPLSKLQASLLPPGTNYEALPQKVKDQIDQLKSIHDILFVGKHWSRGYYIMASNTGPILWSEKPITLIPDENGMAVVSDSKGNINLSLSKEEQVEKEKKKQENLTKKALMCKEIAKAMLPTGNVSMIEETMNNLMHLSENELMSHYVKYLTKKVYETNVASKSDVDNAVGGLGCGGVQGFTGVGINIGGITGLGGYTDVSGDSSKEFINLMKGGTYKSKKPKDSSPPEPTQEGSKGEDGLRPMLPKRRISWD